MRISFIVPTIPIAQPRQRHTIRFKRGKPYVHNYTADDSKIETFKAAVRLFARRAYQGQPLTGPLAISLCFVFPRKARLRFKGKPAPRSWHTAKPDWDNLEKAVADSLSGILYVDDKQICNAWTGKVIGGADEEPHVEITAGQVTDDMVDMFWSVKETA